MRQTEGLMVFIVLIALINFNAVAGSITGEVTKTYTVIGEPTTTFTSPAPPCTGCDASSGGGGGGGGGVSGEDYGNIVQPKSTISITVPVPAGTQPIPAENEDALTINLSLLAGVIGIITIVVVLYLRRKN